MKAHHIGYVVNDIVSFADAFPGLTHVRTVEDPLQGAELGLYTNGTLYFEFIRPNSPAAFTWRFLERFGPGYHHVCFEAREVEVEAAIRERKLAKIRGPMHAVLFDRQVLFTASRTHQIIEFILQ